MQCPWGNAQGQSFENTLSVEGATQDLPSERIRNFISPLQGEEFVLGM